MKLTISVQGLRNELGGPRADRLIAEAEAAAIAAARNTRAGMLVPGQPVATPSATDTNSVGG